MKKIILLIIVAASVFIGCKKYPEGPFISLRSAEHRVYGVHTLEKYTIDGVDSLDSFYDSLGLIFNFYYNEVTKNNVCLNQSYRKDGNLPYLIFIWELINKNKMLKFSSINCSINGHKTGTGPFYSKIETSWNILRLTNKEIKLKTNYNNKEYVMEFELKTKF